MGFLSMQVATEPTVGRDRKFAYEQEVSLIAPGNSDWILIPEDITSVAVTLFVTDCEATVEATTDSIRAVIADTAEGLEWDLGRVRGSVQNRACPVTAVRMVITDDLSNDPISARLSVRTQ